MVYYANLDSNNICYCIGKYLIEQTSPNLILIDSDEINCLGMKYENKEWLEIADKTNYIPTLSIETISEKIWRLEKYLEENNIII